MNNLQMAFESWKIWLIIAIMPIGGFAIDIYTPSLPVITHFFDATHVQGKLTLAIFLFGFGVGQLFVGPLSDRFGRKIVLTTSLLMFSLFSIVAIYSPSIHILLLVRLLQGLTVSGQILNVRAIAADVFRTKDLRRISVYITTAWAISPVIGPVIGGYLQTYIGWHAGFYFLALYAFICFILILTFIPETHAHKQSLKLINLLKNYREVAVDRVFLKNTLGLMLTFSAINVFNVLGPFIIQIDLRYSPLTYGHIALVIGIIGFVGSFTNRFLIKHHSITAIIRFCILLMLLTSIGSFIIGMFVGFTVWMVCLPAALMLYACMMVYPNFSANCSSMFKHIAGTAAAYRGVVNIAGCSLFMALISLLPLTSVLIFLVIYIVLSCLLFISSVLCL